RERALPDTISYCATAQLKLSVRSKSPLRDIISHLFWREMTPSISNLCFIVSALLHNGGKNCV
ncbi:hypothetical protein, partial [Vibrio sp. Vb0888]|uniref:hypothetical protein n=1 Tax=Vibrio sp. Vb0888 TaxID=3074632 RepID=UPI0029656A33